MADNDTLGQVNWSPDYRSAFPAKSAFATPPPPERLPRALFASTEPPSQPPPRPVVDGRDIKVWERDIDDILTLLGSGDMRDFEQAVIDLEGLHHRVEDVVRSLNADSAHSDRHPG